MSLRRRITAAAAVAVAAVAVVMGVTAYLSTRSHLLGELRSELRERASFVDGTSGGDGSGGMGYGDGDADDGGPTGNGLFGSGSGNGSGSGTGSYSDPRSSGRRPSAPPKPTNGGAAGTFQFVRPNGTVVRPEGSTLRLPVTAAVQRIARSGRGSLYLTATVDGQKLEILTVGDADDHYAVQVGLPLSGVDSVLSGLVLPFGLLIGGGVVFAGLLGTIIARSALRPIERFSAETERVTLSLAHPRRLEPSSAAELTRLAHSFNTTLDALERSIDAQRSLIADASHELRTPMAALRSNIQILLEADRLPPEEQTELRESILAELDELTQLVADVLELARGASPEAHHEPVELGGVVHDAVARARRWAPGLNFLLDVEPAAVDGSPDRISRAVTNVIDNARKWSTPNGTIEVTLAGAELTVRDHGPGFADVDLPHVFDRFYRADAARRMPGSGLGLAIVKQAAEAQGGRATAANAPDGGAVVTVSFAPAGHATQTTPPRS